MGPAFPELKQCVSWEGTGVIGLLYQGEGVMQGACVFMCVYLCVYVHTYVCTHVVAKH